MRAAATRALARTWRSCAPAAQEEMGFTCPLKSLGTIRYRAELDHGMIEHELVHMFRGLYDGTVAPNRRKPKTITGRGLKMCAPISPPSRNASVPGSANISPRNGRWRSPRPFALR